jgi:hypothetical protein
MAKKNNYYGRKYREPQPPFNLKKGRTPKRMKKANIDLLKYCLLTETEDIFDELVVNGHTKFSLYKDSNKMHHMHFINQTPSTYKVLLVSHLDTVTRLSEENELLHYKGTLLARGLDNRLGMYTCMDLINKDDSGMYDLLLTDHEECGASTAQYFNCPDYHYDLIVEFDRMGVDQFVQYGHGCKELVKDIEAQTTCVKKSGSYSDIRDIDTDTASVNWGVAFRNYHADNSHVIWDEYLNNIEQYQIFIEWARSNNKSYFTDPAPVYKSTKNYSGNYYSSSNNDYWDSYYNDYNYDDIQDETIDMTGFDDFDDLMTSAQGKSFDDLCTEAFDQYHEKEKEGSFPELEDDIDDIGYDPTAWNRIKVNKKASRTIAESMMKNGYLIRTRFTTWSAVGYFKDNKYWTLSQYSGKPFELLDMDFVSKDHLWFKKASASDVK